MNDDPSLPRRVAETPGWFTWTHSQRIASAALLGLVLCLLGYQVFSRRVFLPDPLPDAGPRANEVVKQIDPNTATVGQLSILPNLGAKRAAAIVEFRETFAAEHPGEIAFPEPESLLQIKGIGDATLTNLLPHLTFPTTRPADAQP